MRPKVGILMFASLLIAALAAVPAQAGGGGAGCSESYEDATGTTVVTRGVCFSPTVLRIQPGDSVRFETADGLPHTVGGIGGSFGDLYTELNQNKPLSYRFSQEGVFPYACMLHPGMGGVVVVGDGTAKAVAGGAVEVAPPKADAEPAGDTRQPAAGRPWLIPIAIALGLGLLGLAAIPRRRRQGSPAL